MDDGTIIALATPPGKGGIAVVRLSGPDCRAILDAVFEPRPSPWRARRSYHGFIRAEGRCIDECLVTLFLGPHSYSGEDLAEISLHGNEVIVEEVIGLACRLGARPALPGEFTYRAFRNNKLDLLQAEAVNALIRANSRVFALMEFGNLEGRLSKRIGSLRERLTQMAIAVETELEFAQEQHLEVTDATGGLTEAVAAVEAILSQSRFHDAVDQGMRVVIAGKVNVGKSSLFNALLLQERSIISHLPGTTRDYIQEKLQFAGLPFQIIDMAGLRSGGSDDIENQGMQRSLDQIAQADAVIVMVDASGPLEASDLEIGRLSAGKKRIVLANKCDRAQAQVLKDIHAAFAGEAVHLVSAQNGENLDAVIEFLKGLWHELGDPATTILVNLRQKSLLERLLQTLRSVERLAGHPPLPYEALAEELRQALRLIGELTGTVGSAEILDGIFAQFCIGK